MNTYIVVNDVTDEIRIGIVNIGMTDEWLLKEGNKVADGLNSIPDSIGSWSSRVVSSQELPGGDSFSYDKTFRGAFTDKNHGNQIDIDIEKSKEIAHEKRRAKREELFKPYDEVIAKQIPGIDANDAEAARTAIRGADAVVQADIETAANVDALKQVLTAYEAREL